MNFITILLSCVVTSHSNLLRTERVPTMQNFSFKIRIVSDEPGKSGNTLKLQFYLSPKSYIVKLRLPRDLLKITNYLVAEPELVSQFN